MKIHLPKRAKIFPCCEISHLNVVVVRMFLFPYVSTSRSTHQSRYGDTFITKRGRDINNQKSVVFEWNSEISECGCACPNMHGSSLDLSIPNSSFSNSMFCSSSTQIHLPWLDLGVLPRDARSTNDRSSSACCYITVH